MDYTDLARVKASMLSSETAQNATLSDFITRASRLFDRLSVGLNDPGVTDYFKAESVTGEFLTNGVIGNGILTVYPHKPIITSVTALSYRTRMTDPWTAADLTLVMPNMEEVIYEGSIPYWDRVYVQISYSGGLGATLADLPADLVDWATVMAIRLFKEARSGLSDVIGVVETGLVGYTKALPSRLRETLQAYARTAPWT